MNSSDRMTSGSAGSALAQCVTIDGAASPRSHVDCARERDGEHLVHRAHRMELDPALHFRRQLVEIARVLAAA